MDAKGPEPSYVCYGRILYPAFRGLARTGAASERAAIQVDEMGHVSYDGPIRPRVVSGMDLEYVEPLRIHIILTAKDDRQSLPTLPAARRKPSSPPPRS